MKVGSEKYGRDIIELEKGYEAIGSWNALYPARLTWNQENIPYYKETEEEIRLKDERLHLDCRFIYEKILDHYLIKKESPSFFGGSIQPSKDNVDLLEPGATKKEVKARCLELLLKDLGYEK